MKRRIPSWIQNAAGEIGQNISTWRRMYGLSQSELASRVGVSRETISRLENGDGTVAVNTLLTVLHVFGVSDKLVDSVNPYGTPFGMARAEAELPKRIVKPRE